MRIGFYNVENLLPADGSQKDVDFASGGRLDWTPHRAAQKIENLAAVISAVGAPDILGVSEVGSAGMLESLADAVNERAGECTYGHVFLAPTEDVRGIGVGVLSRWPWKGDARVHDIHNISDPLWEKPTRPILELRFDAPRPFTLLVNHWPAPRPTPRRYAQRKQAAEKLRAVLNGVDGLVVAVGDFNMEPWHNIMRNALTLAVEQRHGRLRQDARGQYALQGDGADEEPNRPTLICVPQAVLNDFRSVDVHKSRDAPGVQLEYLTSMASRHMYSTLNSPLQWGTIHNRQFNAWAVFDHIIICPPLDPVNGSYLQTPIPLGIGLLPIALNSVGFPRSYDRVDPSTGRVVRDTKGASDHVVVYIDVP